MSDEYSEFVRSHLGGWGRIPLQKTGGIRTFKILQFTGEKNVEIEIITARKATKTLKYPFDYVSQKAEWYYPESKNVNTPNYVVRSIAHPKRQYFKILTNENVYFAEAIPFKFSPELNAKLKQSVLDVLDNYSAPYPTYQSCLEQLRSGTAFARAFSKRFLITHHPDVVHPILVYKNTAIGYDSGLEIVCTPAAQNLYDVITSVTRKAVVFQNSEVVSRATDRLGELPK